MCCGIILTSPPTLVNILYSFKLYSEQEMKSYNKSIYQDLRRLSCIKSKIKLLQNIIAIKHQLISEIQGWKSDKKQTLNN